MKKRLNRMLSTLLICSMVMTLMPTTVFATNRKDAVMEEYAGGLCEHHPEHDDECGYSEGIAGTDCSHEHTDDCYTEVVKCTHRHDEDCYPDEIIWDDEATPSDADRWEPEDCPHMCEEDSECITKKLNCRHEHDDECGYSPATRGTPCEFDCEICGVDDDMKTATPSNAKAVTVAGVQAMIDALPDVEDVRKGNAEKVKAQLDAIDDAKAELSDEEKDFLEETAQLMLKYPTVPCNDCKYCMPCPYGIDIPGILLHYNKCVNEGNLPKTQQDENYKEARRAYLVGYDRSVPKLRQASHCIGCAQCNPHCPQSIDIPKELHRIDSFVEQLKQGTL